MQNALKYAARGWSVFPCHPMDKTPACPHGFHDGTNNPWDVRKLWGSRTNLNIGIATGKKSGFWVLDIDGQSGRDSLEALENEYGKLPETLISQTGKGQHYLFKIPSGMEISNTAGRVASGIDTRGDGGYIVAPPSIHPSGAIYTWQDDNAEIAEAPEWLLELVKKPDPVKYVPSEETYQDRDWSADDVLDMLSLLSPDCGYDDWYQVGMALQSGGWPFTMWDNWSRGSDKYKLGETHKKWESFNPNNGISFGTLVYMAQINGWKPKETSVRSFKFSDVDISGFLRKLESPEIETKEIEISGIIMETVNWINSTSFKLQPELAMMNTIAALGAIFGRRYALQKLNTRTNIYLIGIAESGQGKDNSRKRIKKLMSEAGLGQFIGPDEVRSGPGLALEIKNKPSMITHIDEIGMFMKALFDQKAAHYLREISSLFTKLYSTSDGEYIGGLVAGKPDERMILKEPNLCIYGTTTLGSYADAMKKSAISSGEINRFIVLKSAIDFPDPNFDADFCDPPEHLVSRWSKFAPDELSVLGDMHSPEKKIVMLGDCANRIRDMYIYQDERIKEFYSAGMGALWVRYRENALKIAMIFAIARDCDNPVLNHNDLDVGCDMVEQSIRFMMQFASENMYETPFQKNCNNVIETLKEHGNELDRTRLNRKLRMEKKELDAVIHHLLETEIIEIKKDGQKNVFVLTA